ncbi:hypothetical protein [Methylophilus sp. 3sh_L]|uniref:hypothetical protein n=1 Tax=Methylophilus sp. 3sh_L TaxID=3377114 RepID=UPI00398E6C57
MIPAFDLGQICQDVAGYFGKLVLASLLGMLLHARLIALKSVSVNLSDFYLCIWGFDFNHFP